MVFNENSTHGRPYWASLTAPPTGAGVHGSDQACLARGFALDTSMYDLPLLESWNIALFKLLHGTAQMPAALLTATTWLAEVPAYAAALLMLRYVVRSKDFTCLFSLTLALVSARCAKILIGLYAYHDRPFAAGYGPALIDHAADHSMPSSHVTFVLVLAVICATRGQWRLTSLLFLLGGVMAWARVFVGVHWPLDMLGAVVVAVACGLFGAGVLQLCASVGGMSRRFWRRPLSP